MRHFARCNRVHDSTNVASFSDVDHRERRGAKSREVVRGQPSTAALRWAPLRNLGEICFGLYLLHRPADTIVTVAVGKLQLAQDSLALVPVKIAVAVGLATVSWRLLEHPCLRLRRYFSSKSHPAKHGPV